MRSSSFTDDFFGFFIGMSLGCFGLFVAIWLKPDYLRGALLGIGAQFVLGSALTALTAMQNPDDIQRIIVDEPSFPWEIVVVLAIGTLTLAIIAAAGVWAFGGRSDDDDDDEPDPTPSEPAEWVQFTR